MCCILEGKSEKGAMETMGGVVKVLKTQNDFMEVLGLDSNRVWRVSRQR